MRSLSIFCFIVFALSLPLSAFANDTCVACGEKEAKLIAGNGGGDGMEVGLVTISNCADQVCVEYTLNDAAIAEGWLITETHVEVALAEEFAAGVPQTKKNNPIPGKFEDVQYFEPGVDIYSYCVAFEDIAPEFSIDGNVDVAAHAVVARPAPGGEWTTIWQIGDVESTVEGLLTNYADEFNWGTLDQPAGPTTPGPGLAVDEPLFTNPFMVGVSEDSEFPYNSNFDRGYAINFDVQWTGALGWGGRLIMSWSPGRSALETKEIDVIGDGLPSATFTASGTAVSGAGWFLDTYPLVDVEANTMDVGKLDQGTHTINFKHLTGDGTFWDWIRLEQPGLETETAWAEGCPFTGRNWATYICGPIEPDCCDPCTAPYYPGTVVSSDQGLTKGGVVAVDEARSNPGAALTIETGQDPTNFFSLGYGGSIVLSFPCQVVDGEGDDIRIIEDTWSTGYPLETADVYASDGAGGWILLGVADNTDHGGNGITGNQTQSFFDLADAELSQTAMIKIVDTTSASSLPNNADGFDLNFVDVLHDSTVCPPAE